MTAVTRLSVERYLQNPTEPESEYINLPFGIRFHGLPTEPALLCIEIFSPSDHLSDCVTKCARFLQWAVPVCWIIDPEKRTAREVDASAVHLINSDGTLNAGQVSVSLPELFATLD